MVLWLDADGLQAGAGDPERRRLVAAGPAPLDDQALPLEAGEDLLQGTTLEVDGERQDRAVLALDAALRMTAWVSLSLLMG
jgi:hypothetical protein